MRKLFVLQKKVIRMVDDQPKLAHTGPIFAKLKVLKIQDIAKQQTLVLMYNIISNSAPSNIASLFPLFQSTTREARIPRHFFEIFTRKKYRMRTILWNGPRMWNSMVAPHHNALSVPVSKSQFKKMIKNLIINEYD